MTADSVHSGGQVATRGGTNCGPCQVHPEKWHRRNVSRTGDIEGEQYDMIRVEEKGSH